MLLWQAQAVQAGRPHKIRAVHPPLLNKRVHVQIAMQVMRLSGHERNAVMSMEHALLRTLLPLTRSARELPSPQTIQTVLLATIP